ncbi:MAG TPA: hypothetical protein VF112_05585 [Candidatus Dormibacteraeota bacterium]
MATSPLSPSERDAALQRLRAWRTAIAVAAVAGVATTAAVAAETIPGRADSTSGGAAQAPDSTSAQDPQQQQVVGGDGFQQPSTGIGRGFGRGQAVSGGS